MRSHKIIERVQILLFKKKEERNNTSLKGFYLQDLRIYPENKHKRVNISIKVIISPVGLY
jgi:hypothetical protein